MRRLPAGEVKQRLMRLFQYIAMPSALASMITALKVFGFSGWWIVALVPLALFVLWADHRWVFPQECRYVNSKNLDFQGSWDDIKAIKKLLEERRESEKRSRRVVRPKDKRDKPQH
jgi:hypothetical protein